MFAYGQRGPGPRTLTWHAGTRWAGSEFLHTRTGTRTGSGAGSQESQIWAAEPALSLLCTWWKEYVLGRV